MNEREVAVFKAIGPTEANALYTDEEIKAVLSASVRRAEQIAVEQEEITHRRRFIAYMAAKLCAEDKQARLEAQSKPPSIELARRVIAEHMDTLKALKDR
jgi:hypothetical protein